MKTIEYLPHVADLRIRIEADTLEELFEAGLKGMSQILKKNFCPKASEFNIEHEFHIQSKEVNTLLADFMSALFTKCSDDSVLFCELSVIDMTQENISAIAYGNKIEGFDEDIKSITYYESGVMQNKEGNWETLLIFEI